MSSSSSSSPLVLVTGATGFLASHVVEALLAKGYRVRGTARNPADGRKCAHLNRLKAAGKQVEVIKADLRNDADWPAAMQGCQFVVHTASPVYLGFTFDEKKIIEPAVQGTLRVLRAAAAAGIKRVCLTSSLSAVAMSRKEFKGSDKKPLTEENWSDPRRATAYGKSKVMAERAAWDYIKGPENTSGLELSVVNPAMCYGPVLGDAYVADSLVAPYKVISGLVPLTPDFDVPSVDIRDVAEAHVRTLEVPEAAGQRFVLVSEVVSYYEHCKYAGKVFRPLGYWWIPTRKLPNVLAVAVAPYEAQLRTQLFLLGVRVGVDGSKAQRVLGLGPYRSARQAFAETILSFIQQGLVKKTKKFQDALDKDPQLYEHLLLTNDTNGGKKGEEQRQAAATRTSSGAK